MNTFKYLIRNMTTVAWTLFRNPTNFTYSVDLETYNQFCELENNLKNFVRKKNTKLTSYCIYYIFENYFFILLIIKWNTKLNLLPCIVFEEMKGFINSYVRILRLQWRYVAFCLNFYYFIVVKQLSRHYSTLLLNNGICNPD